MRWSCERESASPGKCTISNMLCPTNNTPNMLGVMPFMRRKPRDFYTPLAVYLGNTYTTQTLYNSALQNRTGLRVLTLHLFSGVVSLPFLNSSEAQMPPGLSAPTITYQAPQRHQEWDPLHCQALELDDEGADEGCDRFGLEPQLAFAAGAALGFPLPAPLSFSSSSWSS